FSCSSTRLYSGKLNCILENLAEHLSAYYVALFFKNTSYAKDSYICYNNKHPGHEFYMHTIALFNQWKKTMIDDEKKKRKERELIEKQISHTNSLCVPKKINQA
uniref:hypothetical protein n=1 Tax=Anaeromusa sp. TaxID=1872520 RepID=UPI002639FCAB